MCIFPDDGPKGPKSVYSRTGGFDMFQTKIIAVMVCFNSAVATMIVAVNLMTGGSNWLSLAIGIIACLSWCSFGVLMESIYAIFREDDGGQ
jgi:hypothetical protein